MKFQLALSVLSSQAMESEIIPIELFFLSLKIAFFLTFRLAASSEGKEQKAIFPLTKPQGKTLGKNDFQSQRLWKQ